MEVTFYTLRCLASAARSTGGNSVPSAGWGCLRLAGEAMSLMSVQLLLCLRSSPSSNSSSSPPPACHASAKQTPTNPRPRQSKHHNLPPQLDQHRLQR